MDIKFALSAGVASAMLLSGASAAVAGGFVAPVVEVEPVVAAPVATGSWAGAYAGGSIGYTFLADDEIGFDSILTGGTERETALGNVDVTGPTVALHLGYRFQRDRWVFGPQLGIEGGSVDDTDTVTFAGNTFDVESKVNSLISLVLKTGYTVNPRTLVYGTLGVTRGDFDYTVTDDGEATTRNYNKSGVAAGFGVEQMIGASTTVFAEYQYRHFGSTYLEYDTGTATPAVTVATPSHSNVKIGVNFRF